MLTAALRRSALVARSTPSGSRFASTLPRAPAKPHMTPREWVTKHVPTEAYPLIFAVVAMSSYGIYKGVHAIGAIPGELRLTPERYGEHKLERNTPWDEHIATRSGRFA